MTSDEVCARLREINRTSSGNPGYIEPLSELEIEGWLNLLRALNLINDVEHSQMKAAAPAA